MKIVPPEGSPKAAYRQSVRMSWRHLPQMRSVG